MNNDQQDNYVRNRKIIATIGTIAFIILSISIIVWAIAHFIYINGKVKVMVSYAPYEATVKIDDIKLKNNAHNWIAPGKYHLTVEMKDFDTLSGEVTVTEDTKRLYGHLLANNDEGKKYAKEHIKDFQDVEGIAGEVAAEDGAKQREQWPIITVLPVKDPHYTIGYSMPDLNTVNVTVTSSLEYRGLATNKLVKIMDAKDLEKYDVIYNDLKNPYEKAVANKEAKPDKYLIAAFPNYKFTVKGKMSSDEKYYGAFLRHLNGNVSEIFRVVLIKDGNSWKLAGTPYPFLTTKNTPDVPSDFLQKINEM